MSGVTDLTRLLEKLDPRKDGESYTTLRAAPIAAINADGTIDITLSGVTVSAVPVVGSTSSFVVGRTAQVLTYKGALLALGQTAGSSASAKPSAFMTFGTPTLTSGSVTVLTPTVTINDGAMYPGTGTTFTIPSGQDGLYVASIVLRYASQASPVGVRQARINVNGVEHMLFNQPAVSNYTSSNIVVSGAERIPLVAGNTVSFAGYQNSGGDLALTGNCSAWLERVR